MLLHKELRFLVQIEILCDHGCLVGGVFLRVAQHIRKVIFFQQRLCKGCIDQKALIRVFQFQHPLGGELGAGFHAVYRHAGNIQLRYFVFKTGRFIVPEHQFALLARRKHRPETVFDLAQCRFSHECSSFLLQHRYKHQYTGAVISHPGVSILRYLIGASTFKFLPSAAVCALT